MKDLKRQFERTFVQQNQSPKPKTPLKHRRAGRPNPNQERSITGVEDPEMPIPQTKSEFMNMQRRNEL